MPVKHLIVPIFIRQEGCPYRCVFCNQEKITGVRHRVEAEQVVRTLQTYLRSPRLLPPKREVAFYGGSFTGLHPERQQFLLNLVQPWIENGSVQGIRISTHPSYVDAERLEMLKRYGVHTIELGLQSTNDKVLNESGRPCSMETVGHAVELIHRHGFKLGLQLMPGLPGDDEPTFQKTVADTLVLRPDFVRLYPALVIRHTRMFEMYEKGDYRPWSLERMVALLKDAVLKFRDAGIPVVRIGLHPEPSLLENLVDGPYHPSIRYLVDCQIGFDEMSRKLSAVGRELKTVLFKVPIKSISIYTGHKRENLNRLQSMFHLNQVGIKGVQELRQLELVAG